METTQPSSPNKNKGIFKILAAVVGGILLVLIIFAVGIGVGLHKAKYSYDWGRNYERNFIMGPGMMGSRGGNIGGASGFMGNMMRGFSGRDFRNGNGISGSIISISGSNIVIKDSNSNENTVAIGNQTVIRSGNNNIQFSDLKQNDVVIVMGRPGDNGTINAVLVRVLANF